MSQYDQDVERRVEKAFRAPEFRKYQKEAIMEVVEGLENGSDVVVVNAPTGSGKSLILDAAARAYKKPYSGQSPGGSGVANLSGGGMLGGMVDGGLPDRNYKGDAFFTTPLNSLVEQLEEDEFIGDGIITIKGRNNYSCVHPEDRGESVDKAICQRDQGFECDLKYGECPYYSRKAKALKEPLVVTNMSYIMAEGMTPGSSKASLGDRDLLMVDECQSLEDFAMNFISFTISENTVPEMVWDNLDLPEERHMDHMDVLVDWLETQVLHAVGEAMEYYDSQPMKSEKQLDDYEKLKQFEMRVNSFLGDIEDNDWIAQVDNVLNKNKEDTKKVIFRPIEIGRFLENLLWGRGEKIILSSATVPGGDWLDEIGLGGLDVKRVNVPSTFPVENRPIITGHDVGKMTYQKRDENAWPMAKKIKELAQHHEGEKGFVHCRSYGIAQKLRRSFFNHGERQWFKENVMMQDKYNREQSLEDWKMSGKQIFFSVAMDEGVDLEGDQCRWQVLAKTLYKSMNDKRVEYRIKERDEWGWYNRHAAIQITQAYGRAVRSKEDEAVFYILDSSAIDLIRRDAELFPKWFLDAIDDMPIDPSRGM